MKSSIWYHGRADMGVWDELQRVSVALSISEAPWSTPGQVSRRSLVRVLGGPGPLGPTERKETWNFPSTTATSYTIHRIMTHH